MKKIVVAEASSTIKSVADTLLRQNGYDVICTSDGLQAWEVIQSEKPALVFAGLNLSGISGLELCKQVSGGQPDSGTPVVLLMGSKDVLTDDQLRSSGARGRLKKPFSPRDLLEAVERVIGSGDAAKDEEGRPRKGTAKTTYKAEVMSSSTRVHSDQGSVYNLDWTDLEDSDNSPKGSDEGIQADSADSSQQLIVEDDQYNLIPDPEEDGLDEGRGRHPDDDDEDYEWFVGEMKREISGNAQARDKKVSREKREKRSDASRKQESSDELKFEDLSPTVPARDSHRPADVAVTEKVKKGRPADGLTQDEIEKIAEKVVSRLAATIAGQLDRKMIYEAIRTVLKS